MPDEIRNKIVELLGGGFSPNGQKGKTNFFQNKLKSLKVAHVKDEMDGDGIGEVVCDGVSGG